MADRDERALVAAEPLLQPFDCAEIEVIDESFYNTWPIDQLTIGLQTRSTYAGSIGGNDSDAEIARCFVCQPRHRA